MIAAQRHTWAALACIAAMAASLPVRADSTTYEDVDGIRYEVTKRSVQVPITQMGSQQQTVYTQQVSTQTVQQQQLYSVPVTQYQLVSTLHGRWNPFITPYWTHEYQPVTTWQQQTANVQIPVQTMAWVPQTQTVQAPSTTYRTVESVTRRPIGATPGVPGPQQMMASNTSSATGPSATLAARPSASATGSVPVVASAPSNTTYGSSTTYGSGTPIGGTAMPSDPPRQPTGYGTTPGDGRYNDSTRRY